MPVNHIKNIVLILAVICISSCSRTMKKEHFAIDNSKKIVSFKAKLNYDGSEKDFSSRTCQVWLSNKDDKILRFRTKGDYVFVELDPQEEVRIGFINCMSYRVFYNKYRLKKVNKSISTPQNDIELSKVIYVGDLEINWSPEVFRFYDLFILGHFNLQDRGPFSMKLQDNYQDFRKFMKENYPNNIDGILNGYNRGVALDLTNYKDVVNKSKSN